MANYTQDSLAALAWEDDGSPTEMWTENGLTATVHLRCVWANRYTVMGDILNNIRGYPNLLSTEGSPISWAATGSITPVARNTAVASDEQSVKYEQALLEIQYQPTENNRTGAGTPEDPYVYSLFSESLEPTAEFLTVNPEGLFWENDGLIPLKHEEAPGMLIPSFDYMQTRYRLSTIPSEVLTLIGHCNDAEIKSELLGLDFPAETLLFQPPTMSRQIDSNGDGLWTLHTRYQYKASTWNKYWRSNRASAGPIYKKKEGTVDDYDEYKAYPLGDFTNILA